MNRIMTYGMGFVILLLMLPGVQAQSLGNQGHFVFTWYEFQKGEQYTWKINKFQYNETLLENCDDAEVECVFSRIYNQHPFTSTEFVTIEFRKAFDYSYDFFDPELTLEDRLFDEYLDLYFDGVAANETEVFSELVFVVETWFWKETPDTTEIFDSQSLHFISHFNKYDNGSTYNRYEVSSCCEYTETSSEFSILIDTNTTTFEASYDLKTGISKSLQLQSPVLEAEIVLHSSKLPESDASKFAYENYVFILPLVILPIIAFRNKKQIL